MCATCLSADADVAGFSLSRFSGLKRILHFLLGTTLLWIFFYYLGQLLLSLPSAFHEGTLWEKGWWN